MRTAGWQFGWRLVLALALAVAPWPPAAFAAVAAVPMDAVPAEAEQAMPCHDTQPAQARTCARLRRWSIGLWLTSALGVVLGAMGGGHVPERVASLVGQIAEIMPTVVAPRAGGGPLLHQTYGGPSSEIALRKAGLIWAGRLNPLKARVLLQTSLRAGLDRSAIAEVFEAFG